MRTVRGKLALAAPGVLAFLFLLGPALKFDASLLDAELAAPFARSAAIGIFSTLLSGILGISMGWALVQKRVRPRSAAWLIAPFCLGSAAWGVLFYPIVHLLPGIEGRSVIPVFSVLIAVNVLQYVPLVAFIAYHSFSQTRDHQHHVASALQLNVQEAVHLIYWPRCRAVLLFTCIVVFCAAASEYDRAQIYFHPSAGTDTQLFPLALVRLYQRLMSIGLGPAAIISNAMAAIIASGVLVLGLVLAMNGALRTALLATARVVSPGSAGTEPSAEDARGRGRLPLVILAAGLIGSFLWSLLAGDGLVAKALVFVALAALIISAIYVAYSCLVRVYCGDFWESGPGRRSAKNRLRVLPPASSARSLFVAALVAVRIVPSIVIYYVVLINILALERSIDEIRTAAWILAHLIYNAAMILPFLMMLTASVTLQEIDFLKSSGVKLKSVIYLSFLSRFKRDFALTLVFSFVLVWNGDAINQALSSTYDSANSEMVRMLTGRNYNIPRVIELVIPAFVSAGLAVLLIAESSARMLGRRRPAHRRRPAGTAAQQIIG